MCIRWYTIDDLQCIISHIPDIVSSSGLGGRLVVITRFSEGHQVSVDDIEIDDGGRYEDERFEVHGLNCRPLAYSGTVQTDDIE